MTGPKRRVDDHVHPEYWTSDDHHRFEGRIAAELKEMRSEFRIMRSDLEKLTARVLLIFGGVALLAFIIPIFIPFVRDWLNIPSVVP